MSIDYIGVLLTALFLALLFLIPALALIGKTGVVPRFATGFFLATATLYLLTLPVIAVFGFLDGAAK